MKTALLWIATLLVASCTSSSNEVTPGTYRWTSNPLRPGQHMPASAIEEMGTFALTSTRLVAPGAHGKLSMPYAVEKGCIVSGLTMGEVRLKIVSPDTLLSIGSAGLPGTYVRVKI